MTSMSQPWKTGMSAYSIIFQLCMTTCALLTVRVHVGPFHPATAISKTAVIFGLVDVPLHSSTRIYGTGNLGFQEFYRLTNSRELFVILRKAAQVFYSRSHSLAPSQLARKEVYFICWVKVCLLHEGIIIPRSSSRFYPQHWGLSW